MPAPVPLPPCQRSSQAEQRVALAPGGEHIVRRLREPVLEALEQALQQRLDRVGLEPQRAGGLAQLRRQLVEAQRDVDADPEHRPALLRAALDQDPADLAALRQHVVGPLQHRLGADELGDRDAGEDREQRRRVAQHERAEQRAARRGVPAPALATAPVVLLVPP